MNCDQIEDEFVVYFFGSLSAEKLDVIDRHLVACTSCLRSFLRLKRDIQWRDGARASVRSQIKLRLDVHRELLKANSAQPLRARWDRPIAIFAAGIALIIGIAVTREMTTGPGRPPYPLMATSVSTGAR